MAAVTVNSDEKLSLSTFIRATLKYQCVPSPWNKKIMLQPCLLRWNTIRIRTKLLERTGRKWIIHILTNWSMMSCECYWTLGFIFLWIIYLIHRHVIHKKKGSPYIDQYLRWYFEQMTTLVGVYQLVLL